MRFRSTLVLALLVAAVGAYLWLVERPAVEKESEKKTLLTIDRDKVSGIVLEYPESRIELAKKDGNWRIVAPRDLEADQTVVKSLLGAIADAELKKTIDEKPESLAPFGLDKPAATVTLTLEDGSHPPKVSVGKTTPVGYSAYARRDDEPAVLLTTAAFHSGVKKDLKDLRDKTVLTFQDDAVQELRIRAGTQPEVVLRKEGDGWVLVQPSAAKADTTQVRSYLSTLRAMRALDFVDEDKSPPDPKYGLTPPRIVVAVVAGDKKEEQKLLVGGASTDTAKKEIYVERGEGGSIFTVGDYLFTSLAKKPSDFRDKTVLAFEKDKVGSVVVTDANGGSYTLEKKDGKWTVAAAGEAKPKDMIIDRFVDDLRTLKGADIASEAGDASQFGLDKPAIKIDVRGADGGALGTILAAQRGTGQEKKLYVAAAGGKTVYTLNDYVFQRIDKRRADFLETAPGTPAPGASPAAAGATADDDDGGDLDADGDADAD
ncbi:MAG TPA: DUF4340 domain-containing protein [Candidatus Binatia bacterium]|nr:DUF4340 domain-containing protein [Candidatus Binatia bacterium]